MRLSREIVDHVAMLARLGLSEEERERMREQLSSILEHVSRIQELDTEAIPPTAQVITLQNIWREDEVRPRCRSKRYWRMHQKARTDSSASMQFSSRAEGEGWPANSSV